MPIGSNWEDVWEDVWGDVWVSSSSPSSSPSEYENWQDIWQDIWGDIWATSSSDASASGSTAHVWKFQEINGTSLPDVSGDLTGTLVNYDWFAASNPEITNGELYWADNNLNSDSKYIRISDPSSLNELTGFTMHFFGVAAGTSSRTLISRGGSITGWELSIGTSSSFIWKQTGVPDLTSDTVDHNDRTLHLFTVRRKDNETELFFDGNSISSGVAGDALPASANGYDLLFHVAEDRIDEVSDQNYLGCTDEISIFNYGQTDNEILSYWRSLQVIPPTLAGEVSYAEETPGNSISINVPNGYSVGESLFAYLSIGPTGATQSSGVITPPSGWNEITISSLNNNGDFYSNLYSKTISGTEPASYTWSISDSYYLGGMMVRVRGDRKTLQATDRPFFNNDNDFQVLTSTSGEFVSIVDGRIDTDLMIDFLGVVRVYSTPHPVGPMGIDDILNLDRISKYSDFKGQDHYMAVLIVDHTDGTSAQYDYSLTGAGASQYLIHHTTISRNADHGSFFELGVLPNTRGLFNSLVGL